jgi:sarcosine oxidase subunit beta
VTADVAVVGAGLFGASTAAACARAGLAVDLYDRGLPGSGDTGHSFGMVRAHYSNEVTVRLAKLGIERIAAWPAAAYARTGYLLPVPADRREACAGNVALGRSLGVDTRLVEPDELGSIEPALRLDGIAAAAYEPDGGLVDPVRMTLAWFAEAVALGARPFLGHEVEDVEAIDARTVVVAAGGWTRLLLPEVPFELRRIDVARVRPLRVRTVVSDVVSNVVARPGIGDVAWAVAYRGVEVRDARGETAVAAADGYLGVVRDSLGERFHGGGDVEWVDGWGGFYDASPDWNPIVGPVRDRVWVVAGMSGHGLKLAPAVGECVAAVLAGTEPPVGLHPLRPGRFADGEPLRLAYGPGARA